MFTSGLILTVSEDATQAEAAWNAIRDAGPFTLGEWIGPCRAAVLEARDTRETHDWHDWLLACPGVMDVEIVFVHWDEEAEVVHAGA
jgi:hypothetical protein